MCWFLMAGPSFKLFPRTLFLERGNPGVFTTFKKEETSKAFRKYMNVAALLMYAKCFMKCFIL